MTASSEVRYTCDRCRCTTSEHHPLDRQLSGPPGWLVLKAGDDPATLLSHYCEECSRAFRRFQEDPNSFHEDQASVDRYNAMHEALYAVKKWAEAYPVQIFPRLDRQELERAGEILDKAGLGAGRVHAQWARHILKEIIETIDRGFPKDV